MYCVYCGAQLPVDDAAYCIRCGAPVTSAAGPDQVVPVGTKTLPLASRWQRVGGLAVDMTVQYLVTVAVVFAFFASAWADSLGFITDPTCATADVRLRPECEVRIEPGFALGYNLALLVIWFLYWWASNALGASLGKLAVGSRVVRADGHRPGFGRGLARTAVAVLSTYAFFIGYLWAFWDARTQTWHDKAAGTFVVRVRP